MLSCVVKLQASNRAPSYSTRPQRKMPHRVRPQPPPPPEPKNDNYLFREAYEISTDPTSFFDEQDPALDRMAKDFASRLVADVMENF